MQKIISFLLITMVCNILCAQQYSLLSDSISRILKQHTNHSISLYSKKILPQEYSNLKQSIEIKRNMMSARYRTLEDSIEKKLFIDSISVIFTELLLLQIIPSWYGTNWDFNGYTDVPKSGVIACGYFVSTTLKHMGCNINRYKLAQQSGASEAKTIAISQKNIIRMNGDKEVIINKILELPHGLYFIGLHNHVGYIFTNGNTVFFIHSNYISDYVCVENALSSLAFNGPTFWLAPISHNSELINAWLQNQSITVILD